HVRCVWSRADHRFRWGVVLGAHSVPVGDRAPCQESLFVELLVGVLQRDGVGGPQVSDGRRATAAQRHAARQWTRFYGTYARLRGAWTKFNRTLASSRPTKAGARASVRGSHSTSSTRVERGTTRNHVGDVRRSIQAAPTMSTLSTVRSAPQALIGRTA